MTNCIWYWTCVCDADKCHDCKEYISANCKLGNQMLKTYQRDVDEALKTVREKWAKKIGTNDAN